MKKHIVSIVIAIILFFVPFFWLKPGFVDLGGDAGRLYFLDPFTTAKYAYTRTEAPAGTTYAIIPYVIYLGVLKTIISSPTHLISAERGLQVSLSFLSIYLIVRELLFFSGRLKYEHAAWTAIAAGIFYVGLITKTGWVLSLETHNQVFLNPLIFFLLMRFFVTNRFRYGLGILLGTLMYSGSFGFSATPALVAFYPLSFIFLVLCMKFVLKKPIPWRSFGALALLFIMLHAFHLFPLVTTVLTNNNYVHSRIFSRESIQYSGVHYFDMNHETLGKISTEIFQPSTWRHNFSLLLVPVIILLGLLRRPSRLIAVTGLFFAATLFLTSANITRIGALFYRSLFFVPGFTMFRSFNEKWYFAHSFFYALLFGFTFYSLMKDQKRRAAVVATCGVIAVITYLMFPFLSGKAIDVSYYQSKDVSPLFTLDPDLMNAITHVKALPEGNVLTLPLTFPYYQIAYGKEGGAYVGVSMIVHLAGKRDYPGFWSFWEYAEPMFDAIGDQDIDRILQILSDLSVRYIFYNSDPRIMDNFPEYPYIYPGLMYSSKDQLPAIRDQAAYKAFLSTLPLTKIYEKGFYTIYEINY